MWFARLEPGCGFGAFFACFFPWVQQRWGGGVWMVVVWGIGFVHDGEREWGKRDIN